MHSNYDVILYTITGKLGSLKIDALELQGELKHLLVMISFLLWQVGMPVGTIDCWVFLSCLEVLNKCEKFSGSDPMKSYSLYTASLWDYARKKVRKHTGWNCLSITWKVTGISLPFSHLSVNIPLTKWFRSIFNLGIAKYKKLLISW